VSGAVWDLLPMVRGGCRGSAVGRHEAARSRHCQGGRIGQTAFEARPRSSDVGELALTEEQRATRLSYVRAWRFVPGAALLLTSLSAQGALKLTYERRKGGDAAVVSTGTIIIDGPYIRVEGMRAGGVIIVDTVRHAVVRIDEGHRSFSRITEADARWMQERKARRRAQDAEHLGRLPAEEVRKTLALTARFDGGFGDGPPGTSYESLGTTKRVAGYVCGQYRVQAYGGRPDVSCFAAWSSGVVTKAEAAQLKTLVSRMERSFDFMPVMWLADGSKAP